MICCISLTDDTLQVVGLESFLGKLYKHTECVCLYTHRA